MKDYGFKRFKQAVESFNEKPNDGIREPRDKSVFTPLIPAALKAAKIANSAKCGSFNTGIETPKSANNGGTTDYYQIQPNWKQAQDIIEARDMNFSQGNILKAAFCFNTPRHSGTNYERELNKIIWFAQRELERIQSIHSSENLEAK